MSVLDNSSSRGYGHLTSEALENLLLKASDGTGLHHLLHSITVCPECRKVGGWLLLLLDQSTLPRRFTEINIAQFRSLAEAPALWDYLETYSHKERLDLVRANRKELMSWGLAVFVARKSKEVAPEGGKLAVELAELAVLVAEELERDQSAHHLLRSPWVGQLLAVTLSYLGNAKRVAGDLPSARAAFEAADVWKATGEKSTDSALFEPELLSLRASLEIDQRRFSEALLLVEQVLAIYRSPDFLDSHLAGVALFHKARVLIEMGQLAQSIEVLSEAKNLIKLERGPRLWYAVQHNLVDILTRAGRFAEADSLLSSVQNLAQAYGGRLDRIRVRWVKARIMAGLGNYSQGRRALEGVRQEFLNEGIVYEFALASLELAILNLQEGRISETKVLASELVTVFKAQELNREALTAVLAFQEAADVERATISLVQGVAATLEHIWPRRPSE